MKKPNLKKKKQQRKRKNEQETILTNNLQQNSNNMKGINMNNNASGTSGNGINPVYLGLAIIAAIVLSVLPFKLWEDLDAGELMVVQSPFAGTLTWSTTPGVKWQGFGEVTKYKLRSQYWFSSKDDQGSELQQSIKVRFNDGGHGNISGSLAWEKPLTEEFLTAMHRKYGSESAVEQQLVRTVIEKSVYMVGPMISSAESYSSRRTDLLRYIEDQIQNGVYQTATEPEKIPDPMTGILKTVNVVKILTDEKGNFLRQDVSPLSLFGVKTFNLSINEIAYDPTVEEQISTQQKATMQVQTAVAQAKEAEQKAITAAKEGEANAAKAKWEQEVIKAQQVTEAQQKLEVAKLNALAQAQNKQAKIYEGEGEAAKQRLIMQANGALEMKLEAYKEVNFRYADALKEGKSNFVPLVVGGDGKGGGQAGSVNELIQLWQAQTAHQLNLDMKVK